MGKKKNEAHFEVDRAFLVLLIASAVFLVGIKVGLSQAGTVQSHQGSEIVGAVAQTDTIRDSSTGNYVDARSLLSSSIPSGAVMFFNLPSCPSGWSALASAQGRYLVGTPVGGTLGAAVGTALSNAENRAVGQHAHTASSSLTGAHTHGYTRYRSLSNGGGLASTWYQTTTAQTSSAGDHTHIITVDNAGSVAGTNAPYVQLLVCQKD